MTKKPNFILKQTKGAALVGAQKFQTMTAQTFTMSSTATALTQQSVNKE